MRSAEPHTYLAFDTCVYLGPGRDTILSCMRVWQELRSSFRILVPHVRCCPACRTPRRPSETCVRLACLLQQTWMPVRGMLCSSWHY